MADDARGKRDRPMHEGDQQNLPPEADLPANRPEEPSTLAGSETTILTPKPLTEVAPPRSERAAASAADVQLHETQEIKSPSEPVAENLSPPAQHDTGDLAATGRFELASHPMATGEFTRAPDMTMDVGVTGEFSASGSEGGFSVGQPRASSMPTVRADVGDYEILGVLGRGGMGVVYRARDKKLGREVALKMVLSGAHASQEQLQRFIAEAQAVAHLQHPNIVQIFEVGEQDDLPYFSLEFVDGQALDERLRDNLLTDHESAKLMETICRAMQYAHEHNILHRDLKPANVLLSFAGIAKITDFGLAKKLEDADESSSTRTGTVMGTPSYMAPEQARGLVHELGPATDQYSLGAMLYEFLTGRPPFVGAKAVETIMQVVHEEPVPPRQLRPKCPVDLETICLKALQKEPDKRYESCLAMADDLRRYLDGVPIEARPVNKLERCWRWCRRNPNIAIPSAAALLMLLLATGVSTWSYFTVAAKNVEVLAERDYAKKQERIAKDQQAFAKEQQLLAEAREKTARAQSKIALDSLQFVQTNIDDELKTLPGMAEVRIRIMRRMAEKWDELEVALTGDAEDATGERGEAMATLMASRARIAESLVQLGQVQPADDIYAELVGQAQERIAIMDGVDAARFNLAFLYTRRADTQRKLSPDPQDALDFNLQALAIIEDIKANPKPKVYDPAEDEKTSAERQQERDELARNVEGLHDLVLKGLGSHYLNTGDLPKAADYFTAAYDIIERMLTDIRAKEDFAGLGEDQKDTLTAALQLELDTAGLALAYIYLRLGRTEDSLARYKAAISGRREIVERRPTMGALEHALAGFLGNFGLAYLWLDRPQDAEPLLAESLARHGSLLDQDPKNSRYISDLATANYRFGTCLDVVKNSEQAAKHFSECKALRTQLADMSPNETNKKRLMLARARCGEIEEAMELIDEMGQTNARNGELHLERARSLSQLSRHVGSDEERETMLKAALTALERAIDEGFADPFRVEAEQDLDPLHQEARFQNLLVSMRSPAN